MHTGEVCLDKCVCVNTTHYLPDEAAFAVHD